MPKVGFKHSIASKLRMKRAAVKRWGPSEYRFWRLVEKSSHCWSWLGETDKDGYGRFWYRGSTKRAHRCSWMLCQGRIPTGQQVLHRCDNPRCVRPDHLFLGTLRDNVNDMLSKGRSLKGERHSQAKLTEEQVICVLQWRPGCGQLLRELAAEFRVSITALELVRSGTNWKHLYHLHSKFDDGGGK